MAYVTTSQLEARLGATLYARLTDRVSGTTASATVAQQLVDEAEAEANSSLAARYPVPISLAAHPELAGLLAARVLDIAEHNAWKGSPFVSDPPQRVHVLQATALQWFKDVAAGRIVLPVARPSDLRPTTDDAAQFSARPRVWSPAEMDDL